MPRVATREHARIIGEMLEETASNHHKKYWAKHFTVYGAQEYKYAPRKGQGLSGKAFFKSYLGRKNKQKGHMNPLVWSGESKTLASIRDIRRGRLRATIVQHARGLNRKNPRSSIRMNEEIRAVSPAEIKADMAFAEKLIKKKYRTIRGTKITRI